MKHKSAGADVDSALIINNILFSAYAGQREQACRPAGRATFLGIRRGAAWDADTSLINPNNPVPPGLLGDKTFREGFAVLGRLGLSFDALVLHPQLNDVANPAGIVELDDVAANIRVGAGTLAGDDQDAG